MNSFERLVIFDPEIDEKTVMKKSRSRCGVKGCNGKRMSNAANAMYIYVVKETVIASTIFMC